MTELHRSTRTGKETIYPYRSVVTFVLAAMYVAWTAAIGWVMWLPLATGGLETSQRSLIVAYYVVALLAAGYGVYGFVALILAYRRGRIEFSDEGLTHHSRGGKATFVPWAALQRIVRATHPGSEWTTYSLSVDFVDPEGKTRRLGLIDPLALFSPHVDFVAKAVVRRAGLSSHQKSRRWLTYEDIWER